jgi:hypothetical protein
MAGTVAELPYIASPDGLAKSIAGMWENFNSSRNGWIQEKKELRNYIFATDTSTTSNASLPWKNSTTLPKLCQLRDNLHANYLSAAFPNDNWLRWEGYTADDDTLMKKQAIQAYTSNKVRASGLRTTASQLLLDYIDYGNCFAKVEYVHEEKEEEDGTIIPGYIGPRVVRISPFDLVFDPRASSFDKSPHIIRSLKSVGEIKALQMMNPEDSDIYQAIEQAMAARAHAASVGSEEFNKQDGMVADGFGSLYDYYTSNMVELLTFEGTMHDPDTGVLLSDMEVVIIDRVKLVTKRKLPNWAKGGSVRHCGWRLRPDNLWAMGPLDNLVGMQYRIDHLENLKADVFDLIAHPPLKIRGIVEDFVWAPGAEIHISEGDVEMMAPPTNALAADMQIQILEQKMEEYSGAPREAMGLRTPGEKTAFEVQSLQNAAGRIFQEKITSFEINLLEPLLNDFLESARRNMDGVDYARVMDDDLGVSMLMSVTKEDITAKGKIRPIGARHFAAQAQTLQNLTGVMNSPLGQTVMRHIDSIALSKTIEDLLGLERYGLFSKNAQLYEQAEAERTASSLQEELAAESGVTNQGDIIE